MGSVTPLAVTTNFKNTLSKDLRVLGDVFFDSGITATSGIAQLLSSRLIHHWETQKLIREIKNNPNQKQIRRLIKRDPLRWESLTLAGKYLKNLSNLHQALQTNPYSPRTYLELFKLSALPEKKLIAKQAQFFCPHHPQILSLD